MTTSPKQARWIQDEVLPGNQSVRPGHPRNPEVVDLAGSNGEHTSGNPAQPYYVVDIDSTSSTATLQGFTFSQSGAPYQGQLLLLMTTAAPTNNVTVEDGNGTATDPFQLRSGGNEVIGAADDAMLLVYDGDGWQQIYVRGTGIDITAASETNDGMTADPETAAENGFLTVDINGTTYQIPAYDA